LTHADWTDALEMYSPHVEIVEVNTNQILRLTASHAALLAALEEAKQALLDANRNGFKHGFGALQSANAAIKSAKELG
jgi:hypothetical protein